MKKYCLYKDVLQSVYNNFPGSSYQIKHYKRLCSTVNSRVKIQSLIQDHTQLTRDHMTPEIALHLITKQCPLWSDRGDKSPFTDPFWAFYWPGGQVITRFILDNPALFCGHRVLDVGSGCAASSIACCMVGAQYAMANDVDPVAIEVAKMNSRENQVSLRTESSSLIGQQNPDWTTILLGDMFYDEDFRDHLVKWLIEHFQNFNTSIFIGDPGRLPLEDHPIKSRLTKVAEYDLSESCKEENNGLSVGFVWKLDKG